MNTLYNNNELLLNWLKTAANHKRNIQMIGFTKYSCFRGHHRFYIDGAHITDLNSTKTACNQLV